MMTNEIDSYRGNLPVKSVSEMIQLGQFFEQSGMFGCSSEGQGIVLVMSCLMENLSPIEFRRRYHLVDGNPTMRTDYMLAMFTARGGDYEIIERSPDAAEIKLWTGSRKGAFRMTWKEAQAESYIYKKDGKTLKTNWSTERRRMQMLWARVVSDAVRAVDPGVCAGTYSPEEVSDFATDTGAAKTSPSPIVEPPPKRKPGPKPEQGEAIEAEYKEEKAPDYTVVPAGALVGEAWAMLDLETLEKFAASTSTKLQDGHRKEIKKAIEARKEKAQ